jgi:hypothetical protein
MAISSVWLALALAAGATSWGGPGSLHGSGGYILPDGPGDGYGFPNGNPDGYGYVDYGIYLPLGANRTGEYFFPRFRAIPPNQMFLPQYYNPYLTRGQRFLPYSGMGGWHPAGGPPTASALTPVAPYREGLNSRPRGQIPAFTGRIEAPAINTGSSGLTP